MKSDKLKKLFLPKAQSGMYIDPRLFQTPNVGNILQNQFVSPQQDFSVENPYGVRPKIASVSSQMQTIGITEPTFSTPDSEEMQRIYDAQNGNTEFQPPQYNDRLNLINPYGGVDPITGLAYGAFMAGQGKGGQAALGIGRGLLGAARIGMNAYSKGKAYKDGLNAQNNTFNPNYVTLRNGGEVTMAELLTGNFITNTSNPNVEIEEGEMILNSQTGQVQEAVGEKHENGGIPTYLPPQSKVLSDYDKVGKINAKELSKFLNIKVKANDTYAGVLEKYSNKIGVKKNIKEEAKLIEKAEDLLSKEDNDTKDLNSRFLQTKFQENEEKKQELNQKQQEAFQKIFDIQEKSKPTQVPIEADFRVVMQQGGAVNPQQILEQLMSQGMSEEEAIVYMEQQMSQPNIIQQAIQALRQGATQEEVLTFLMEQGMTQEQAIQVIQQASQPQQTMRDGGIIRGILNTRTQTVRPYVEGAVLRPGEVLYYGEETTPSGNIITLTDAEAGRVPENTLNFYRNIQAIAQQKGLEVPDFDLSSSDQDSLWAQMQQWVTQNAPQELLSYTKSAPLTNKGVAEAFKRFPDKVRELGIDPTVDPNTLTTEQRITLAKGLNAPDEFYIDQFNDGLAGFRFPAVQEQTQEPNIQETSTSTIDETEDEVVENTTQQPQKVNRLRNVVPMLPNMFTMPPSAMQIPRQDSVSFNRISPVTRTPEVSIAQANNQANFAIEQAYANNPNLAPFLAANLLGTTQQSANQAIAETDAYNAQAINQANLYNAQAGDKEQLMNIQLSGDFERRLFGSLANQEADWRRFFTNTQLQQRQNWQDVNNLNLMNQLYPNFQSDGSNIYFSNARDFLPGSSSAIPLHKRIEAMTEKERKEYYKTGKLPS